MDIKFLVEASTFVLESVARSSARIGINLFGLDESQQMPYRTRSGTTVCLALGTESTRDEMRKMPGVIRISNFPERGVALC